MATLQRSFGAQQKQIDEEMARRGVGASSIASGYYGDLAGQQANAQASLLSGLLTNQANNEAQDRAQAQGAGQASVNSGNQQDQFFKNLSQQMGIAGMTDKTANRGIDVDQSKAQNEWLTKLIGILSSYGGSSALGKTVTEAGGGVPEGTGGTGGTTGKDASGKKQGKDGTGSDPKSGYKSIATPPPSGINGMAGGETGGLPSGIAAMLGGAPATPPPPVKAYTPPPPSAPPPSAPASTPAPSNRQALFDQINHESPTGPGGSVDYQSPGGLPAGIAAMLGGAPNEMQPPMSGAPEAMAPQETGLSSGIAALLGGQAPPAPAPTPPAGPPTMPGYTLLNGQWVANNLLGRPRATERGG